MFILQFEAFSFTHVQKCIPFVWQSMHLAWHHQNGHLMQKVNSLAGKCYKCIEKLTKLRKNRNLCYLHGKTVQLDDISVSGIHKITPRYNKYTGIPRRPISTVCICTNSPLIVNIPCTCMSMCEVHYVFDTQCIVYTYMLSIRPFYSCSHPFSLCVNLVLQSINLHVGYSAA